MPMKQPPKGLPMTRISKRFDKQDAEILKTLAEEKHCQQRIITDAGLHYIYCGGYFHGKATKTKSGLRCQYHLGL